MDQRLSIITLGVSDLEKSKQFYCALGWQVASEEDAGIVAYNLNQMTLALYPKAKLADDANIEMNSGGFPSFTLAYNVASENAVDETLFEAQKIAGANIIKPAEKVFWGGYSGYFSDPDNFLWEVAYNPYVKLGPNSEFQWNS